jgi:hypothetical protein
MVRQDKEEDVTGYEVILSKRYWNLKDEVLDSSVANWLWRRLYNCRQTE